MISVVVKFEKKFSTERSQALVGTAKLFGKLQCENQQVKKNEI